ncbi:MAG: hypothetical protein ABDH61_01565 [Acidilobaceae archaeon]
MHDAPGIPGHASHNRHLLRLQRALKELGYSYEAEGDVTRIHLEGSLVEVRDEPGIGLALLLTAALPYKCEDDCASSVVSFSTLLSMMKKEAEYELDRSIPGYPMLRARVVFENVGDLVETLIKSLDEFRKKTTV